ncbi:regucalcin-like isoform X2 [Zootermopsis nevadensis]|uniref:regucalcin-like isoform X2 n=1 Tax=Zootermopsis nevadensis TaxID=136037 RepID=UPI000B8E6326|nr:regucalcin-like isoform X2 [Zootermopsis nevadensis]
MSVPKIEQISAPVILGEGPHWDHDAQALYYIDIKGSTVHKYVPATNTHTTVKIDGGEVSLVIPLEGTKDKFVITVGRNVAILTWDGESSTPTEVKYVSAVDNEKELQDNRLNDGKADPIGRLWAGTMGAESDPEDKFPLTLGSLFSFSKDWKPTKHLSNITVSNGLAWSEDLKSMYYIDSPTRKVEAFDFDAESGKIYGMATDTKGKLWVACFEGSQVIRVDPANGKLLRCIPIPALKVTSVAFGGPQLDELYVTSADILTEEQKKMYPESGATFRVTGLGVKGYPGQAVKL